MRCKPGDLAIVVGACTTPGLRFRLVIVERLAQKGDPIFPGFRLGEGAPAWWCRPAAVDSHLPIRINGILLKINRRPIADEVLRPIRPNDGVDESLTWCPKELHHG